MFLAERFWPEQKIIIIIIIIIINIEEEGGKKKENKISLISKNTEAITNRAIYMCDKRAYCKEEKTN